MREYLLPPGGAFYKANLHAHTTVSDGVMTPSEVKEAYRANGYSVVAFTDHDVMVDHSELSDDGFLALRGWEISIDDTEEEKKGKRRTYHLSLIAEAPGAERQVFFTKNIDFHGNARDFADSVLTTGEPVYGYRYSAHFVNRLIRAARAAGFMAIYNHPRYSLQNGEDYLPLEGLVGMEIYNGASTSWGFADDGNTASYERMLRKGNLSLLPIAADDSHTRLSYREGGELFSGFMMIKAPSLSYTAITSAIKNGDCYASSGPEIRDLYLEDGRVYIETSRVREILYRTDHRGAERRMKLEGLTAADFRIDPDTSYFRLEIVDEAGRRAVTRAYPTDRYR